MRPLALLWSRKSLAITAVLLFGFQESSFSTSAGSPARINAIFSSLESDTAPGAAVLVIENGKPAFERGYGVSDLRSLHKIDSHTNFRLASVTKQFTAMAIMLLVKNSKLRYEDRLTDVFPEFPEYGKSITIRNLLNHTSGLVDYEDLMSPHPGTPEDQAPQIKDADVLTLLEHQNKTKFTPGTRWDYSNSGYVLLGLIVENRSGQPFGEFLRTRIFQPLKMEHTILYEKGSNEVTDRAYGYTKNGNEWIEKDQSSTSATRGDGGVYSSLDDLAKWDAGLEQHTLLSKEQMKWALSSPNLPDSTGKSVAYGFGWFLDPYRRHARMHHYGETVSFRTNIQRFINDKLTIIVLSNREDLDAGALALKIADLYFEVPNAK